MGLNTTGNLVVGGTMELSGSTIQVSGADLVFSGSVLAKNDDVQSNYYTKSQVDSVTGDLQSQLDNIPAGSDTEIQFNSSGSLSSDPEFTWSNPVLQLGLGPSITLNTTSGIDMSFVSPPGGDYKITRSILCSGVGINLVNATSASGGDLVEVTDDLIINTLAGNADQFVSLTSAGKLQASGLDSTDFVNVTGDTMTGSLTLASGSDLTLSGDSGDNIWWGSKANAGWDNGTNSLRILAQEAYGLLLNVNGTSNGIAIDSDGNSTFSGQIITSGATSSERFGYQALNSNTGNFNTAVGYQSMLSNTNAGQSVGIGYRALASSNASNNVAVGYSALDDLTSGVNNTGVGSTVMRRTTTGDDNTAVGYRVMDANLIGNDNVGIGYQSLYNNISSENTGVGSYALYYNTGTRAVAVGYRALFGGSGTVDLTDCVGIGVNAGEGNSGAGIVAIGYRTLRSNEASNVVAIGTEASYSNTTGFRNLSIGYRAGYSTTTGAGNVAIGNSALNTNTTSSDNTAIGDSALRFNTGSGNTAVGEDSLVANTTGSNNTAIGNSALSNNTTFSNVTGLGNNSQVTASNQVQLGDSSTTTYAYGAVQDRSDERDKADIKDSELGLDFIIKLRPVDFKWDYREDYVEYTTTVDASGNEITEVNDLPKDGSKKRERYHHGLIAQEVKTVLDDLGTDFGGYQDHSVNGGEDVLSLGYNEFISPLIKAVQEQQAIIEDLKSRIEQLENI